MPPSFPPWARFGSRPARCSRARPSRRAHGTRECTAGRRSCHRDRSRVARTLRPPALVIDTPPGFREPPHDLGKTADGRAALEVGVGLEFSDAALAPGVCEVRPRGRVLADES
jgi:hypothetical protein